MKCSPRASGGGPVSDETSSASDRPPPPPDGSAPHGSDEPSAAACPGDGPAADSLDTVGVAAAVATSGPAAGSAPDGEDGAAGESGDDDAGEPRRRRRGGRIARAWRRTPWWGRLAGTVAVFAVVVIGVTAFVVQPFVISSGSMENTLHVGDRVLVNKLSYRFGGQIHRGDVVVFDGEGSFLPDNTRPGGIGGLLRNVTDDLGLTDSGDYVKRVVGVAGDEIRCCDAQGRLLVNDAPVDEPYLYAGDKPSKDMFDVRVPSGGLWVMGDHRSASQDSRDLLGRPGGGIIPVSRVVGRVVAVVWPLSDTRTVPGAAQLRQAPAAEPSSGAWTAAVLGIGVRLRVARRRRIRGRG